MRLIYIANARIPTEKAHGVQIVKTCEALAKIGVDLELWLPERKQPVEFRDVDLFNYYNCQNIFKVRGFYTLDLLPNTKRYGKSLNALAFFIQEFTFVIALLKEDFAGRVVYTRCLSAAIAIKFIKGARVYYEMHGFPKTPLSEIFYRLITFSFDGITTVAEGIEKLMNSGWGKKACLIPHAVDLSPYQFMTKSKAREILKIDKKDKIAVYAGSMGEMKGTSILLQAAELLQDSGLKFYLVGKADGSFKLDENLKNVTYVGQIPYSQIYLYQVMADILVQPGGRSEHYLDK